MVFSSLTFLFVFLPVVYILNYFIRKEYSNCFLLLASLVFYAWGEPVFVFLMMASILLNWFCGQQISKNTNFRKKFWLSFAVACDLLILGYYKYTGFFIKMVNSILGNEVLTPLNISLPIGISFFTFQAISYIIDVYRGTTEVSPHLINCALYISFFPQLIAGPIVKYRDINFQIENRTVTWFRTAEGFRRFIYGLAKKVLIANVLGLCVDTIYSFDIGIIDPRTAWIGALAYSFQIYYDFSGYSDMAIGLGKMFGFDYLENFNYPYLSSSVTEFWRRWHISLGSWFKEYLYIPLGGNRKGKIRNYINLVIIFLLTGLWHGANTSFVLWGAYHGLFTIVERLGLKRVFDKRKTIGKIYCFFVVNFGWVLFRAGNTVLAVKYLSRMIRPWLYQMRAIQSWKYLDNKTIVVFLIAVMGSGLIKSITPQNLKDKWINSVPEAIYCSLIFILCIAAITSDTYNPFIYFQF